MLGLEPLLLGLPLGSRHHPLSLSATMKVSVKLYSILTHNLSEEVISRHPDGIRSGVPFEVIMPTGSTIGDLVTYLSLAEDLVKITFVNGRHQELDYRLQPEDQVGIFPPIAGG